MSTKWPVTSGEWLERAANEADDFRPFLTAEWRHLAMLNYEVNPKLLDPYLPRGVEVDLWEGRTYVSLVGFLFLNTRVLGVPVPFHRNFEDVHLRFYVRRRDRRGVVFVKEIVPRAAIAWVARSVYRENYLCVPMRHRIDEAGVEYRWRYDGRWSRIAVSTTGPARPLAPGSHEEFIAEHYWGYTRRSQDATEEYRVEHPPWMIRASDSAVFDSDVTGVYPDEFGFLSTRPPESAFVAEGSAVTVSRGRQF